MLAIANSQGFGKAAAEPNTLTQQEKDAGDFKPQNAADSHERAEKATEPADHSTANLTYGCLSLPGPICCTGNGLGLWLGWG